MLLQKAGPQQRIPSRRPRFLVSSATRWEEVYEYIHTWRAWLAWYVLLSELSCMHSRRAGSGAEGEFSQGA